MAAGGNTSRHLCLRPGEAWLITRLPRMTITRLSLINFRNYADAVVTPGPGFVLLTGDNGAGKTNILEAVSLLAPGRGIRRAANAEIARDCGGGGFAISARLDDMEIGTGALADAPSKRIVRINGATRTANALSEWLSIIWVTPSMDRLFTDSGSERRRFLDRLVLAVDPHHAHHSSRYDAAMRQRNRLLGEDDRPDEDWLRALEQQMATHGAAIIDARNALVEQLNAHIVSLNDSAFPKSIITIDDSERDANLARALAQSRARDGAAGRTLTGPHRSDLRVLHGVKNQPAAMCSTGEQKALLLGIVLAHASLVAVKVGRRPVLLLDEVSAHLDIVRRQALFTRLSDDGGQVWLTGTERALFAPIGEAASWINVADGKLISA